MATLTDEERYAVLQTGIQAASASTFIGPALEKRRQILVLDAVRKARSVDPDPSKRLSDRDAYVFVMALAATYDLEDALRRMIDDGQKAGQHFTR